MNLTIINADGTVDHQDCTEIEIATLDNAHLKMFNLDNPDKKQHVEIPFLAVMRISENHPAVNPESKCYPFPYVLTDLRTMQKKNLLSLEFALSKVNEYSKLGLPFELHEYRESQKHYQLLHFSLI